MSAAPEVLSALVKLDLMLLEIIRREVANGTGRLPDDTMRRIEEQMQRLREVAP